MQSAGAADAGAPAVDQFGPEAGVEPAATPVPIIADNLAEAQSLEPLVRPDSSNLMVGHIVLFNTEFLQLQDEVRNRGAVSYINCVRHRPASIMDRFRDENPLHAVMVHDLYATQALLDRAEPCGFSAQYHRNEGGDIDLALAQLRWDQGPVASFAPLDDDCVPSAGFGPPA